MIDMFPFKSLLLLPYDHLTCFNFPQDDAITLAQLFLEELPSRLKAMLLSGYSATTLAPEGCPT